MEEPKNYKVFFFAAPQNLRLEDQKEDKIKMDLGYQQVVRTDVDETVLRSGSVTSLKP
jgi:hypothetical protein